VAGAGFLLREEYCWLVAGGCFVLREKYCWLVADKPNEQGELESEARLPNEQGELESEARLWRATHSFHFEKKGLVKFCF
jgi:hypothetical protein